MVPRSAVLSCLASFTMLAFVSPAALAAKAGSAAPAAAQSASRTQLARELTSKWGLYVQKVYGVQSSVWANRMAPSLVAADPSNLRNALKRDTFEGAMAEVSGQGYKLSDDQAISLLAANKGGSITPQVLGALGNDLSYTPLAPCRIVDTRSTTAGVILAGQTRSFDSILTSSFTSQGGSAGNCGTLGVNATAIAVNITAVQPAAPGFATAYPFNTVRPDAASLNYAAGAIVNNGLIIQLNNPATSDDFTLFTLASSHYVVDIVGYFAPPVATALQCESVQDLTPTVIVPGAQGDSVSGSCSAGYTIVSGECNTTLSETRLIDNDINSSSYGCQAFNGNASTNETLNAIARCCRVPGR